MKKPNRDAIWQELVALVMDHMGDWRKKVTEATGLPFSQFRALRRLGDGPLTLKELAESMGTDAPAASVIVNALEEAGLVKREQHPEDRRAKLVSLTPAGKKVVLAGKSVNEEAPPMIARLGDADVVALERVVQLMRANNS